MTDYNYKWLSFWMTLGFILQIVIHLANSDSDRIKDFEQKVTQ